MDIISLFPTPVGCTRDFISERERSQIYNSIKKKIHISHGAITGDGSSTHGLSTREDPFLNKDITQRLEKASNVYARQVGYRDVQITKVWSNIQNVGSKLMEHTHPDSTLAGALYINVGKGSKIYFHNPNPYAYFTTRGKSTEYNFEYFSVNVYNGQLVLFPAWLKHGKNDYTNDIDDRVVVSFNCSSRW